MSEKIQDFFLSCKECVLENPRNFYGSFSLGPFKNSQGLTVANALRRTLLSEIHGIAITHLEIEGVTHEYSTLLGMRESILDLLLNFKHIVLKNTSLLKKPVFGYLNVRGPGIIRASDLKLPPIIQCVDPDQYIATLNENGKLVLKFTISDFQNCQKNTESSEQFLTIPKLKTVENPRIHNFSFLKNQTKLKQSKNIQSKISISEQVYYQQNPNFGKENKSLESESEVETSSLKKPRQKINALWVDPLFNPVLKVNYAIETIEPFQRNIPNQIVLIELWTNGSIHPRKAFYEALLYLKTIFDKLDSMRFLNYSFMNTVFESEETNTQFLKSFEYDFQFYNFLESKKNKILPSQTFFLPQEIEQVEKDYVFDLINIANDTWSELPLERFNFPSRITKTLAKNNIFIVSDLLKFTPKKLKKLPGIGNFCISIIQKHLQKLGLKLGSEEN